VNAEAATQEERARRSRRRAWLTRAVIFAIVLSIFAFWSWMVGPADAASAAAETGAQAVLGEGVEKVVLLMGKALGAAGIAFGATFLGRR
jgi:hypothetical protein